MVEYVEYKKTLKKIYSKGKFSFSQTEIRHLAIAFFVTLLTILVFQSKGSGFFSFDFERLFSLKNLLMYLIAFGTGFILHELGHKFSAQYYNLKAEFRADFNMLFFIFFLALISPFILLAPGAVMVQGNSTIRQIGIISVMGPIVNLVIGILCFIVMFFRTDGSFFFEIVYLTLFVNLILGIFNMLPFWVLDGKKVLMWNSLIYYLIMGLLIILLVLTFRIF